MKSNLKRKDYEETVGKLLDTEAMGGPKLLVKCPVCRHARQFANQSHAEIHKSDLRRALISFVSRAIHKFLD